MKLQTISRKRIINRTKAGRILRRFLLSKKVYSIVLDQYKCGWLDGGCWALASALTAWTAPEGSIRHVYNTESGQSQHAVCYLNELRVYLDGDGICTEKEMLLKMKLQEDYYEPLSIRDATTSENDPRSIWQHAADQIQTALQSTLGPWHSSAISKQLRNDLQNPARYGKLRFLATCDKFRRTEEGEHNWQAMIMNRQQMSRAAFTRNCKVTDIMQKGENWNDWGSDDPDTAFFRSTLEDGTPCCYAQYAGFEFIFKP